MTGAALLLAVAVPACRTWRAEPLPARGAPDRVVGEHVRATQADGNRIELAQARIVADTLRAERWQIGRDGRRVAVAVPVDSVRQLETRRFSAVRTGALVGGIVVGLIVLVGAALSAAGPGFPAY